MTTKHKIITAVATIAMVTMTALPVFAEDNESAKGCTTDSTSTKCVNLQNKATANAAKKLTAAQQKAKEATDKRIASLNKLITRIQDLKNIQDAQKSGIISTIQSLITSMTTLENEINTASSTAVVKDDTKTIMQDYRIYALAIPQLHIVAASDRIMTIVTMMGVVGTKLQTRLSQAASSTNTTALQSQLADFAAKISDAKAQAQAAFTEVSPLLPDGGDKTKMAANTAALKDAKKKIDTAKKDLEAANKDAKAIIKAIQKAEANADKDMLKQANNPPAGTATTTP